MKFLKTSLHQRTLVWYEEIEGKIVARSEKQLVRILILPCGIKAKLYQDGWLHVASQRESEFEKMFASFPSGYFWDDKMLLSFLNEVFSEWDDLPDQNSFVANPGTTKRITQSIAGLHFKDCDPDDEAVDEYWRAS